MNILGLSCHYHDAAAALVMNDQLAAAAEEERFTRIKHDHGFPARAAEFCLRQGGLSIDEIDYVVFYEKPLVKFDRILETVLAGWPWTFGLFLKSIPAWVSTKLRMTEDMAKRLGRRDRPLCALHHLSHAASAFFVSPFDEAAIITADGVGEWATTAWGVGRGSTIEMRREIRFPHSIGLLFSAITAYLGFRVNDAEWKVMGLAPYGEPRFLDRFRELADLREDGSFRLHMKYFAHDRSTRRMHTSAWKKLFGGPPRRPEGEMTGFHRDLACSGQRFVEEMMLRFARHVQRETGQKRICLAGGVALNCVANWRILEETDFEEIFIQPAAGDSGGALGAALYLNHAVLGRPRSFVMRHAYWGPTFDDADIHAELSRRGADFELLRDDETVVERTVEDLIAGRVVGWFQGRMEFGPRALGARSLLADPRRADMRNVINAKVKFREAFRPFAPAVLKERAHEFFEMPRGLDAPFMLLVPKARSEWRNRIPAVTHQDGTGRVQTLTQEENGLFYRLVKRFGEKTGVPILLNTSFNVRGEPIVCAPADAYNTFVNTGIDVLVMGRHRLDRKPDTVDYEAGRERSVALEQSKTAVAG